jgi:hypothetical protein
MLEEVLKAWVTETKEQPAVDFHPELSRAFHLEVSHF